MDRIKLGNSGLMVSRIGIGGAQWGMENYGITDPDTIKATINHAIDSGINYLDTAESYADGASERYIGQVLKERGDRENLILATKIHPLHLGFDEVLKACNASLRRLQTDYIDLFQIHAPSPTVPISETMIALRTLLDDGKIRHVGVSNFQVSMCEVAINSLDSHEIISNQLEYSILNRNIEKAMLKYATWRELVVIAYSPLARGMLTGKFMSGHELPVDDRRQKKPLFCNKENIEKLQPLMELLKEIGDRNNADISQVALNWLLKFDNVIPLPGAKSREQVDSHVAATTWTMPDDDWNAISKASEDLRLNNFYHFGQD
ncbi:MAG: aldo/keto reductase [Thermoplasmata archaeon]|nr:aldo/keto reductase [Thermoplasmata archaeon]